MQDYFRILWIWNSFEFLTWNYFRFREFIHKIIIHGSQEMIGIFLVYVVFFVKKKIVNG